MIHVEIAGGLEPALVRLDGEGADQTQAARGVGKDPHDEGAALQLLVQPLQHVGRLHMLVVRQRQPVVGQGLLDVILDPACQLGVLALPLGEPGREVAPDLGELAPIVKPAQLHQAIVS
jgi:hypothetical protein